MNRLGFLPSVRWTRRHFAFSLAFAALLVLASAVLIELGLRVARPFVAEPFRSELDEAERITWTNLRATGGILLPADGPRDIVVVGDSLPFGSNVRGEDAFPEQLARLTGWSVANLGIHSESPPTYNRMVEVGSRYRPKQVVYCIFANNFNTARQNGGRPLDAARADVVEPEDAGRFERQMNPARQARMLRRWLTNAFLSLQVFKLQAQKVYRYEVRHTAQINGRQFVFGGRRYLDPMMSWQDPLVHDSVAENQRLVRRVRDFGHRQGFDLLVVLLPAKEMIFGPLVPNSGDFYSPDYDRTYREMAGLIEADGIPLFDLTEPLREAARRGETLFLAIDGHPDEVGHARIAQLLADRLRQQTRLLKPG